MKVLMITGSPHKNGTTAALAQQFVKGAEEAGHEIIRFDAAFKKVHPCTACEACHTTDKGCVFKDDMEELNPQLLSADAIVFISPIYYYGMTAQIKVVMDRFYANGDALHRNIKTALLLAMEDDTMESAEGPLASFKGMSGYLGWKIAGTVIALACSNAEALEGTEYPEQAYQLGRDL